MNKTAVIALICGLGTSVWTWWPQSKVVTTNVQQAEQVLTATGQTVDPEQIASIRVVTPTRTRAHRSRLRSSDKTVNGYPQPF